MNARFENRATAGRELAISLGGYAGGTDLLVVGLDPGGVTAAGEVAEALAAELDVMVVRSILAPSTGAPPASHDMGVGIGAVAPLGARTLDQEVIAALGLSQAMVYRASNLAQLELEAREEEYRRQRPPADIEGRRVIVVDDSVTSGLRMQAAIRAIRQQRPRTLVVAAPVVTRRAEQFLDWAVDDLVTLETVVDPRSVAACYGDFPLAPDTEQGRHPGTQKRHPLTAASRSVR